jgi:hypothetical protein
MPLMESHFRILTIFIMSNELKPDDREYLCNAQVILQTLRRFLVFETVWTRPVTVHRHLKIGF